MIDFAAIVSTSLVCVAGVMSPGPNFIAVTHRAVTGQRTDALALVTGIVCVNVLWASAALFGLNGLFSLFPWLFWSIKLFGGVYLVWFGYSLVRQSGLPLPTKSILATHSNFIQAFRDGVITNLSNPKSMVFYASVFSAAVPIGSSPETLTALVGMVAIIAALWYGGVAFLLSTEIAARIYRKGKSVIERTCGALLITFGLRQALSPQ